MTQLHSIASLDYGDGRTCVCRVCECGKHSCPGKKLPFTGFTTYRDEYVPKKCDTDRQRRRRNEMLMPTKVGPEHFKTTKQEAAEALRGRAVDRPESYKPRDALGTPIPFDATTTNRADYPGHIPDLSDRRKRQHEPLPQLKGVYNTTNSAMQDPIRTAMEEGRLPKPPKPIRGDDQARQDVPFDGLTSYTVEYPPKAAPRFASSARQPFTAANMAPDSRDFATTHSATYTAPPLHMRHICPAALVPPRPPSVDGHVKLSVFNIPSGDIPM